MTIDELIQSLREKLHEDGAHIIAGAFIRPEAFADLVKRDLRTLRRWREREFGPPLHAVRNLKLYALHEVAEFLMSANVRRRKLKVSTAPLRRVHCRHRPAEPCSKSRRSSAA